MNNTLRAISSICMFFATCAIPIIDASYNGAQHGFLLLGSISSYYYFYHLYYGDKK